MTLDYLNRANGSHLVDVLQFVNDLVDQGVGFLHFNFRVVALSFDAVADHTEGVAVWKCRSRSVTVGADTIRKCKTVLFAVSRNKAVILPTG